MTSRPTPPESNISERGAVPGMPRWVKAFIAVSLVLFVLFALVHGLGGGFRGHGG